MELQLTCMECTFAEKDKKEISYPFDDKISVEMNDEGAYIAKCPKGHTIKVIIQNPKFEILFDLAIVAYLDGYSREAVANLTASYERFLKYCIDIIMIRKKIDHEIYEETWKKLKNQSERQLGAFLVTWLSEFNKKPNILNDKQTNFRNSVIHKGYIPSDKEILDYICVIYNLMYPMLLELKTNYDNEIQEHTMLRLIELNKKYEHVKCNSTTMGMGSTLGLYTAIKEYKKKEVSELIDSVKSSRRFLYKKFQEQEHRAHRYWLLETLYGKYI